MFLSSSEHQNQGFTIPSSSLHEPSWTSLHAAAVSPTVIGDDVSQHRSLAGTVATPHRNSPHSREGFILLSQWRRLHRVVFMAVARRAIILAHLCSTKPSNAIISEAYKHCIPYRCEFPLVKNLIGATTDSPSIGTKPFFLFPLFTPIWLWV